MRLRSHHQKRPAERQKKTAPATIAPETIELVVRTLLKRYGVVCWRLLEREADWLPPWRDLIRVLHRLEARGEIRGGRFIARLSGEQFALPEAIPALRRARNRPDDGTLVCISGVDPLNLVGTVLSGTKVPRIAGSRVLYRDGIAIATRIADTSELLSPLDAQTERAAMRLLRGEAASHADGRASDAALVATRIEPG
jgi:ATP-dependent Lhr-like helicase